MALSLTQSLLVFYLLFCFARMVWAGPFDLGLYGALNNWFVARRALCHLDRHPGPDVGARGHADRRASSPCATAAGAAAGWRSARPVLIVGFVPVWLLLVRRPEDVGLVPDRIVARTSHAAPEPRFSRAQAMRTRAFWLLSLYTVAGLSGSGRRQPAPGAAPDRARASRPIVAATVISFFSAMSAVASFGVGFLPRRWPVRYAMSLPACC